MSHRSRLCYITIDTNDLDRGVEFWCAALNAEPEPDLLGSISDHTYRRLRLPSTDIRVLLQKVPEPKQAKTRVHIDIETDDVDAEVHRLTRLGAKQQRRVNERGFNFCVMEDPFNNEFCILQPEFPELLTKAGAVWET